MLEDLGQDLRYAFRQLRRRLGFTTVAVLTMGLGIGANTAVFSVVDALLLRPLPFAAEGRLVSPELLPVSLEEGRTTPGGFLAWTERLDAFTEVAAWSSPAGLNLTGSRDPTRIHATEVSTNFFATLGVSARRGRTFLEEEGVPGRNRVAVLSWGTWRDRFGADPELLGRAISLDEARFTVVGVAPPSFRFPEEVDAWIPAAFGEDRVPSGSRVFQVVGRLAPGVGLERARAELEAFRDRNFAGWYRDRPIVLRPIRDLLVGNVRPALLVLMGATGLILLIGCANLANLFLARASERRMELSIRASLGADAGRLLQQLSTEAMVVALLGGAAGCALAVWGVDALVAAAPPAFPRFVDPAVDARLLAFALGLTLLTGLAFGLWPAVRASRPELRVALDAGTGRGGGGPGRRTRILVVGQVALTLVLLVAGGLLLDSLRRLGRVDPGFDPEGVLTASISLPGAEYPDARRRTAFLDRALDRIRRLPGVEAAGAVNYLPLGTSLGFGVLLETEDPTPEGEPLFPTQIVATPGYFESVGLPVRAGRGFEDGDTHDGPPIVLVDEALARKLWPDRDPLRQRLRIRGDEAGWREVVGVIGGVRTWGLKEEPDPAIYLPHTQAVPFPGRIVIRGRDPAALAPGVRGIIQSIDPDLPVYGVAEMEEVLGRELAENRFLAFLLTTLAAVAALLAAAGLYGVLAHRVARRRHEIGVRMAMGAPTGDILRRVLGEGLSLTLVGCALGVLGALASTRLLEGLLYQVEPRSPAALAAAAGLLVVVALAACWVPARRAAAVDPATTLREE